MSILNKLLKLIFPVRCIGCDTILCEEKEFQLCDKCLENAEFFSSRNRCRICSVPIGADENLCTGCKTHERYFIKNISCAYYSESLKAAVRRFKFEKKADIFRGLGEILLKELIENDLTDIDVILAVPIHKNRLSERGFNQSDLLAKYLSRNLGIFYSTDALVKIKDVPPQSTLKSPSERIKNVAGAFAVQNKAHFSGKCVLLVDDVFTTGATLSEISRLLLKNGAKAVYTATAAMAGKNS